MVLQTSNDLTLADGNRLFNVSLESFYLWKLYRMEHMPFRNNNDVLLIMVCFFFAFLVNLFLRFEPPLLVSLKILLRRLFHDLCQLGKWCSGSRKELIC